jgi:hypothetical protein
LQWKSVWLRARFDAGVGQRLADLLEIAELPFSDLLSDSGELVCFEGSLPGGLLWMSGGFIRDVDLPLAVD